jgi:hypothetical protein
VSKRHGLLIRAGVVGAAAAATCGSVWVGSVGAQPSSGATARDRFAGTITSGTGRFAGDHGAVLVQVVPGPVEGGVQPVTVAIVPSPCPSGGHCLVLQGRVTGRMRAAGEPIPDAGITLRLSASGRVSPAGRVSATGTIHGTGFIARGHESLRLSISGRGGSVLIDALSGLVPGFTAP